jgi:K+/H+ antiporter YhaU regulatory subunit KhtT
MEIATTAQHDRAGNAIQVADAEIARFRQILQQIDDLETEFEKIKRIREIVRTFRARVEQMDRRLG